MAICPICGAPVKVRRSDSETSPTLIIRTRVCCNPLCAWASKTHELICADPTQASEAYRREIKRLYHLCEEVKS